MTGTHPGWEFGDRIRARERANLVPTADELLNHPASNVPGAPGNEDLSGAGIIYHALFLLGYGGV